MFQNYLKIAWRNIVRNKVYTFINVLGLSLGVCACIVIYLLTDHELGYDKFHSDQDRIYRITGELTRINGEKEFLNSPFKELASIEHKVRGFESKSAVFFWEAPVTVPANANKRLSSDKIVIVEPQYFDIFQYEWIAGDKAKALTTPYQVVLTARQAKLYFEDLSWEKMIDQTIIYQDSLPLSVVGIIRDWEDKSDVAYTDFISLSTAANSFLKELIPTPDWRSLHPHRSMAFVKLSRGTSAKQINAQLEVIRKTVRPDDFGTLKSVQLQSLIDMHFSTDGYGADDGDGFRKADLPTLYLLIGLSVFILIIACINFINLSTAQSIQRAKEVGVRKVMGGNRVSLIFQFLSETFVLTFFAVWVAVLLVKPVLSLFSHYIPREVTFELSSLRLWIFLVSITIITSVLAGFYPAKILSAYLPAATLKGEQSYTGAGGVYLRKGLIIFQFTMSLIFIIGTLVIKNQIEYMNSKDKGFKTDAIITINSWTDESHKLQVLSERNKKTCGC